MALKSYNQTLQKTGKCIAIKAAINRQTMNSSQSDLNVATLKSHLFEAAESAWGQVRTLSPPHRTSVPEGKADLNGAEADIAA